MPIALDQSGTAYLEACVTRGAVMLAEALVVLAAGSLPRRSQRESPGPFRARELEGRLHRADRRLIPPVAGETMRFMRLATDDG